MTDRPRLLLEGRDLTKEFTARSGATLPFVKAARVRAVDRVDIELREGEIVALVGESGSGKTTLGRMLARLEDVSGGQVCLLGDDITKSRGAAAKKVHRTVQIIFQNPYESLNPRHTVRRAVTEPLSIHRIGSAAERSQRAEAMLEAVGLSPAGRYLDSFPDELSGGQRQRVAIARAMVLEPRVLIADEPISMLDASIRSSVLNVMLDLRERFGLSILFISHDLASARYISDRILVMYRGKLVESGPSDDVVSSAAHPYTRLLLAASSRRLAAPRQQARHEVGAACRFAPRCPLAREVCWTTAPPFLDVGPGHAALCHFALEVHSAPELSLERPMEAGLNLQ